MRKSADSAVDVVAVQQVATVFQVLEGERLMTIARRRICIRWRYGCRRCAVDCRRGCRDGTRVDHATELGAIKLLNVLLGETMKLVVVLLISAASEHAADGFERVGNDAHKTISVFLFGF